MGLAREALALRAVLDELDRVNHADDGRIDGRVRALDRGHGRKAFDGKQNLIAKAGIHSVEREQGFTALAAVKMEGLNNQDLATLMGGRLLRCYDVADHSPDEHFAAARSFQAGSVPNGAPGIFTRSTMPTMVASVGTLREEKANAASRPRHQ